jgi:hypothetical protein
MSNMQRFKNDEDEKLITSIDDSIDTMAVVDSCGISSQSGGLQVSYAD